MKVYLSGDLKSNWQDKMPKIKGVEYYDPRKDSPQSIGAIEFVTSDLKAVKNCNLVFCYIRKENPSGIGAAFEVAVAHENKIPVITVWEKDYVDPFFACLSLYLYSNLDSGIERLTIFIENKAINKEMIL